MIKVYYLFSAQIYQIYVFTQMNVHLFKLFLFLDRGFTDFGILINDPGELSKILDNNPINSKITVDYEGLIEHEDD